MLKPITAACAARAGPARRECRIRRPHCKRRLWSDGLGVCLFAKRLESGRFIWPSPAHGVVTISPAQLGYLLEGIDWRMPQRTWRPELADLRA